MRIMFETYASYMSIMFETYASYMMIMFETYDMDNWTWGLCL